MRTNQKRFSVFLIALLVLAILTGCSAKSTPSTGAAVAPKAPEVYQGNSTAENKLKSTYNDVSANDYSPGAPAEEPAANGIRGTGFDSAASGAAGSAPMLDILAQRKIIRNANLSIEVDDFYQTYGNLQAMLNGTGYVQESNIHRDFYYYEDERKTRVTGNITLRVDASRFDGILNDLKGLGEVIDDQIYSTDVTDQFYDTEGRLKILKIEYAYLEEYMKSLNDPDSIFKTRMRMTELQTEIERLTGTLNKWTDLVDLSTIYIQMTEKYPEEMTKTKDTYWDRLKESVGNSLTGIVKALGDVLIFIIDAIPTLVILGLIGLLGYWIVKRFIFKRKAPPQEVKKE
jgi:hypothetical protein